MPIINFGARTKTALLRSPEAILSDSSAHFSLHDLAI
jgi:hypothetical protein